MNRFPDRAHAPPLPPTRVSAARGRRLVLGLVALGLCAAGVGIAWQRGQTRQCLAFYGPEVARAITTAPRVELWSRVRTAARTVDATATSRPLRLIAAERIDVSGARGLVHLRRGLVEDANFAVSAATMAEPQGTDWAYALVFSSTPVDRIGSGEGADAAVAILFADGGEGGLGSPRWLSVVGRPGLMPVGRIGRGIRAWIDSVAASREGGGG